MFALAVCGGCLVVWLSVLSFASAFDFGGDPRRPRTDADLPKPDNTQRRTDNRTDPAPSEPTARPRRAPAGRTVLVIEDERPIRELTALYLQRSGMRVITAADGYAGLALFQRHQHEIDLALVDYKLPGLDGPAVCERILEVRPQTPILLSSGYRTIDDMQRRLAGAQLGFVQKPYGADALLGRVNALLAPAG